jgi:hypothetical protein
MSVAMIFAILPIFQLGFLPAFLFSEEYFYTIPISNIFGDLFSFGCPIIYAFTVYVYMRTAPNAPLYPRRRKIVLYDFRCSCCVAFINNAWV